MSKATKLRSVSSATKVFKVLSDETRLRLIITLQEGQQHVSELCKRLRLPQPTVSHHLGVLRNHGLVQDRRDGKLVFYSINEGPYNRAVGQIGSVLD